MIINCTSVRDTNMIHNYKTFSFTMTSDLGNDTILGLSIDNPKYNANDGFDFNTTSKPIKCNTYYDSEINDTVSNIININSSVKAYCIVKENEDDELEIPTISLNPFENINTEEFNADTYFKKDTLQYKIIDDTQYIPREQSMGLVKSIVREDEPAFKNTMWSKSYECKMTVYEENDYTMEKIGNIAKCTAVLDIKPVVSSGSGLIKGMTYYGNVDSLVNIKFNFEETPINIKGLPKGINFIKSKCIIDGMPKEYGTFKCKILFNDGSNIDLTLVISPLYLSDKGDVQQ